MLDVLLAAAGGLITGSVLTWRAMPRIVARLDPSERVSFARRVTALAKVREVSQ